MHVRVCVDCGEEYRPEIARCADCGGALEDRHDDDGTPSRSAFETPPGPAQPIPDTRALASSANARDLVPFADRLLKAGVEFRIASRDVPGEERPRGFELRVKDADRAAAVLAVAELAGTDSGVTLLEVRAQGDPGAGEDPGAEPRCPACDARVGPFAAECPECGLGLEGEHES